SDWAARTIASRPKGTASTSTTTPTKPSTPTSLRSRAFIRRSGPAMSFSSRTGGAGLARGGVAALLGAPGRAPDVLGASDVELEHVFLTVASYRPRRAL